MTYKTTFLLFLSLGFGLITTTAQTAPLKPLTGGVLNGKATNLVKPAFPAAARAVKASGAVNVQVTIDESGSVVSASAVSGHPLLRQVAEQAALQSTFAPTLLSGQPVKVTGIIVYNFVSAPSWVGEGIAFGVAETKGVQWKITLPDDFISDEREQLNKIYGLSVEEQRARIPSIITNIKAKLSPLDLWNFEFGLAKGRIITNIEDDNIVIANLAKIKELSTNRVDGVQDDEFNKAVNTSKFVDKVNLTAEDRKEILKSLR